MSASKAPNLVHLIVMNSGASGAMGMRVRFGASLDAKPPSSHWRFIADQEHQIPAGGSLTLPVTLHPGSSRLFQVVLSWLDNTGSHEITEVVDAQQGPAVNRR